MKRRGFTLIEVVVVIAIIGILVSVAIPSCNTKHDAPAQQFTERR